MSATGLLYIALGALLAGEVLARGLLFSTGQRSVLRPYVDLGWAAASSGGTTLFFGEIGLRTEFVSAGHDHAPVGMEGVEEAEAELQARLQALRTAASHAAFRGRCVRTHEPETRAWK